MSMKIDGPVDVEGASDIVRAGTVQASFQVVAGVNPDNSLRTPDGTYPRVVVGRYQLYEDIDGNLAVKRTDNSGTPVILITA